MSGHALLIGNSDGIGLALTRKLLAAGWTLTGVSRSRGPVEHPRYEHASLDVAAPDYRDQLAAFLATRPPLDVCIYCAGTGDLLDVTHLTGEARTFQVNLVGLALTIEAVLPAMLTARKGHIIGLSSIADDAPSAAAPSYAASKAGFSSYLLGLALALRPRGVYVTNVRLGFVDTKMAKSRVRPFIVSADTAANVVIRCLRSRPMQKTFPWRMSVLVRLLRWMVSIRIWFS